MAADVSPGILAKTGRRRISMKKKLLAALSASAILLAGCQTDSKPVIGVAQLVDQTSLNIIQNAMLDEFEELGYKDGENVVID